jgi:tetratricopeptide (TPR) repeat protein
LKDSELVYERGIFPNTSYTFKHALTQEVAYNSLLLKARREIHETIGGAIEELYADRLEEYCELLAYHYVRSDNKEKAVEYLILANQKTNLTRALEQAKVYFDEAMRLLENLPETLENRQRRIFLLATQHHVFLNLLKLQEYHEMLIRHESMAAEIGEPGTQGAFYAALGYCEYSHGPLEEGIRNAARAVELCEAGGNVDGAVQAYLTLGFSHLMRGDFDCALRLKETVLKKTDKRFNTSQRVRAMTLASIAYSVLAKWDQALEETEAAEHLAQENSDAGWISWARTNASLAYTCKGDLDRAIEYGELAIEKAPNPYLEALGGGQLAWALCRKGDLRRGIEILTETVRMLSATGYVFGEMWYGIALGEGYWLFGEYDKAREALEAALKRAEGYGGRWFVAQARRLLGEIALKTNPHGAAPEFQRAISIFKESKAENDLAMAYSGMGRYHKQQGDVEEARKYLTKALEIFERLGTLIEPDKVKKELSQLPTSA